MNASWSGGIGRRARPAFLSVSAGRLKILNINYFIYAIKSKKRKYIYVGISNKPDRRIEQHNKNYNKTTRAYTPFNCILIEKYNSRQEARTREKYLKCAAGKRFLYSL